MQPWPSPQKAWVDYFQCLGQDWGLPSLAKKICNFFSHLPVEMAEHWKPDSNVLRFLPGSLKVQLWQSLFCLDAHGENDLAHLAYSARTKGIGRSAPGSMPKKPTRPAPGPLRYHAQPLSFLLSYNWWGTRLYRHDVAADVLPVGRPESHSARFASKWGQMADDQNEEQHLDSFPKPSVGAAREAEERCRVAEIAGDMEKLGRALEGRDRAASLGTAERAKSSPAQAGPSTGRVGKPSTPELGPLPIVADMSGAPKEDFSPGWKVRDNPRESASCRGCPLQGRGSGAQGD